MGESIAQIREKLETSAPEELPELMRFYQADTRQGVQKLLEKCRRAQAAEQKEQERLEKMLEFEHKYQEFPLICGIDEAGRGPLAGPVVAGAVILPKDCKIRYLNDSKQLSEKRREELYDQILAQAVAVGTGMASPERIDEINILQATYEAMRQAVSSLSVRPDLLLNDAVTIPNVGIRQVAIVKGDARSLSIAAASVIAKVTRDRIMKDYDPVYPAYGFAQHKGYGSAAHIAAIQKYGPCDIHRRSFLTHFI